jgi:hypothetical protein
MLNVNGTYMTTEAKEPTSGTVAFSPEPAPTGSTPSPVGAGTPERKNFKSGYAREVARRKRLLAEIDDLKLENAQLRQELAELETAFQEVAKLNSDLAGDLRQALQRAPVPSFAGLMGNR